MNVKTKGIDMNDQVLSGCVNRFTKKSCIDIGMRQKENNYTDGLLIRRPLSLTCITSICSML